MDSKFFEIFKNKVRREIIKEIIEKNRASFTELKNKIKINPGTLTFHLKKLKNFIEKDSEGKYIPKKNIISLYEKLLELKEDYTLSFGQPKLYEKIFTLYPIFKWINQNRIKAFFIFLPIIIIQFLISIVLNLCPFFLIFYFQNDMFIIFTSFIIRLIYFYIPIEIYFFIRYREKFSFSFFLSVVFSIFLFFYFPSNAYKLDIYSPILILLIIYLIIIQSFFLFFMATAIKINKNAKKVESFLLIIILMEIANIISFGYLIFT